MDTSLNQHVFLFFLEIDLGRSQVSYEIKGCNKMPFLITQEHILSRGVRGKELMTGIDRAIELVKHAGDLSARHPPTHPELRIGVCRWLSRGPDRADIDFIPALFDSLFLTQSSIVAEVAFMFVISLRRTVDPRCDLKVRQIALFVRNVAINLGR